VIQQLALHIGESKVVPDISLSALYALMLRVGLRSQRNTLLVREGHQFVLRGCMFRDHHGGKRPHRRIAGFGDGESAWLRFPPGLPAGRIHKNQSRSWSRHGNKGTERAKQNGGKSKLRHNLFLDEQILKKKSCLRRHNYF